MTAGQKAALRVDRLFLNSDVRSITITSMSMSVTMSFFIRASSFLIRLPRRSVVKAGASSFPLLCPLTSDL